MNIESFIAVRYLVSKRKVDFISIITVMSAAGVTVGVAVMIIVLSVMNGFEKEVVDRIVGTNAHVVLLRYDDEGIADYQELTKRVEKVPHVLGASPFVFTKAMVSADGYTDGIALKGVDLDGERRVTTIAERINPPLKSIDHDADDLPGIVLGKYLASRLHVHVGDVVSLTSPMAVSRSPLGMIPRIKKFRMEGVFESGMYDYDSSFGFVSVGGAQDFLQTDDVVTGIQVRVDDKDAAPKIAEAILAELGGFPFRTENWIALNGNLVAWMRNEKVVMWLLLLLIVLVAAFNIITSLIMAVMEKTRDIGVLKSMGISSRSVMRIFMFQGLLVAGIGTAIGSILGLVGSLALNTYKLSLPSDVYFVDTLPVKVEWLDVAGVVAAAIFICFAATIYPSWRAARLTPVEAIRYE
jgi:lipoprotein-releasing system permease protein